MAASSPARFEIRPLIAEAEKLSERIARELPSHDGLQKASALVVEAALRAQSVAVAMRRPLSLHRLPVFFLVLALAGLAVFVHRQFLAVTTLRVAFPDRDAFALREQVSARGDIEFQFVEVPGSFDAVELLRAGGVDLGYVQGGVSVPAQLPQMELDARELVLFFVRDGVEVSAVKRVLTSTQNEGSHAVAQHFFRAWALRVDYVHLWKSLTSGDASIPTEVDAVLVVKDASDEQTLTGIARVIQSGFHFESPTLGARAERLSFLEATRVPVGYFGQNPVLPPAPFQTYAVKSSLVARQGLTPRQLNQAMALLHPHEERNAAHPWEWNSHEASDLFQGVEALLSIVVNVVLGFLALLGLDVWTYRRQFHGLNTLVSLVSLLQANKDVLGVRGAERQEHVLYLSLCSDLLSLISSIAGYYTQENSSLLFNSLPQLVHQRCDMLKLNIQLKLLHALIP